MSDDSTEGTILEKKVGDVIVRVTARPNEKPIEVYERLEWISGEIRNRQTLEDAISKIKTHFQFTGDNLTTTGINTDYHRVMLSLIFNFNKCMGATDVSNEWGGINTGNVSRVFTGSKKSTKKYVGHFERCDDKKYRFTNAGLTYALNIGLSEILAEIEEESD